ncbi:von Willebrand factor D and EGF domain-containing protein [Procambarus clarkii]|uniref:von Willebrand factor D and EGF domain-containing protein n=1 Tax=Procambarus clarkii TaxID=6728 RepID=UPI0037428E2F
MAWAGLARERRVFSANSNPSYASSVVMDSSQVQKYKDCRREVNVANAQVRCALSGCRVRCNSGYKLPSGRGSATLVCDQASGQLSYDGQPWTPALLACLPYCGEDGCHNGGQCLAPGLCKCARGYTGDQCQTPEAPTTCPQPDLQVQGGQVALRDTQMVITCDPGYSFPIGGRVALVDCLDGVWQLPGQGFEAQGPLVCSAECDPPCQNGGACIENGKCDCPPGYWGPLCQVQRCPMPTQGLSHSSVGGTFSRLKVECHKGYKMSSGKVSVTLVCRGGQWSLPGNTLLVDNDINCYPV